MNQFDVDITGFTYEYNEKVREEGSLMAKFGLRIQEATINSGQIIAQWHFLLRKAIAVVIFLLYTIATLIATMSKMPGEFTPFEWAAYVFQGGVLVANGFLLMAAKYLRPSYRSVLESD